MGVAAHATQPGEAGTPQGEGGPIVGGGGWLPWVDTKKEWITKQVGCYSYLFAANTAVHLVNPLGGGSFMYVPAMPQTALAAMPHHGSYHGCLPLLCL